jgi:hypothetical protein
LSESRFPPRIKSGAGFFGIMLYFALRTEALMLSKDVITAKRDALVRERATLLARLNAAEGAINLCDVFLAEIEAAPARMERPPPAVAEAMAGLA